MLPGRALSRDRCIAEAMQVQHLREKGVLQAKSLKIRLQVHRLSPPVDPLFEALMPCLGDIYWGDLLLCTRKCDGVFPMSLTFLGYSSPNSPLQSVLLWDSAGAWPPSSPFF